MTDQIPFSDADRSTVQQQRGERGFWLEDANGKRFTPFMPLENLVQWKITRGLFGESHPDFGKLLRLQKVHDNQLRKEKEHGR